MEDTLQDIHAQQEQQTALTDAQSVAITKKCLTSMNNQMRKDDFSFDDSNNNTGPSNEFLRQCQENIAQNMMQLEELGLTMRKTKVNNLKLMSKKAAQVRGLRNQPRL